MTCRHRTSLHRVRSRQHRLDATDTFLDGFCGSAGFLNRHGLQIRAFIQMPVPKQCVDLQDFAATLEHVLCRSEFASAAHQTAGRTGRSDHRRSVVFEQFPRCGDEPQTGAAQARRQVPGPGLVEVAQDQLAAALGQEPRQPAADLPDDTVLSSRLVCELLGKYLDKHVDNRAILSSALRAGVPIYVPAFTDSELGLDLSIANHMRMRRGEPGFRFDPFLDLDDFTPHTRQHATTGIFTIGGGVPRNWAQQVGPYLEILRSRLGSDDPVRRYRYAVRICPEPEHWGGLSGCSYTEGVSWGKFVPESEGGRHVEVHADATIAWPIVGTPSPWGRD